MSAAARADDHGVALAYPVNGSSIRIDGDLSDWPAHLPRYAIATLLLGAPPSDDEDYSAWFRVAYSESENVLYAAIQMQDAEREEPASNPVDLFKGGNVGIVVVRFPAGPGDHTPLGFLCRQGPDKDTFESTLTAWRRRCTSANGRWW